MEAAARILTPPPRPSRVSRVAVPPVSSAHFATADEVTFVGPPSYFADADEETFVGPRASLHHAVLEPLDFDAITTPVGTAVQTPPSVPPEHTVLTARVDEPAADEVVGKFVRGFFFGVGGCVAGFVIATFLAMVFRTGFSAATVLVTLAFLVAIPSLVINAFLRERAERVSSPATHPTFYAPGPFGDR